MKTEHSYIAKSIIVGIVAVLLTLLAIEALSIFFPNIYGGVKTLVARWGPFGVFVGVFLGSTALPFPTDLLFITSINLSTSFNNKVFLVAVAIIAGFLAAVVNYWLAKIFREKLVFKFVSQSDLEGAKAWFDKYGPFPILFFGVIPSTPVFDPITYLAGLTGMDFKQFALFSFVSRFLHFAILAILASQVSV